MSLVSPYSHIAKYAGRNRCKADSFYNRATSYKRIERLDPNGNQLELSYIVRNDLLPKRAICSKCDYWLSQNQTKAAIKLLRAGRVAICPRSSCGTAFRTLESLF